MLDSELEQALASLDQALKKDKKPSVKEPKDDEFKKMKEVKETDKTFAETTEAEDDIEITQYDRERFVYAEPEKFFEKLSSFSNNTVEVMFVIGNAALALYFTSGVACGFFLISYLLLFTSVQKL